jgi:xylulokinase
VESVLCCDLGGSGLRAALVSTSGQFVAEAFIPLPTPLEADGRSEVDPASWWDAFEKAAAHLKRDAPESFAAVAAVAVCGMTRTQVLLDGSGDPVRPAITWRDTRAAAIAGGLPPIAGESLDAFHPVARLAWLEAHEPRTRARIARIVDPKDYLGLRLTGRAASDPVSLSRLIATDGAWRTLVPDLVEPGGILGTVQPLSGALAGLAGRPVVMGSHDTWAAVTGLGAMRPGLAYNIAGTSEVLGLMTDMPATAAGLLRVSWGSGLWQLGGPSQNGADVVPWLLALTGEADLSGAALERLLARGRSSAPLLFLPFLSGERTPYWDADLRGAFLGLSRSHGPNDLAWAVIEGSAHAAKVVLDLAEAAVGAPAREVRIGGGGGRNARWRQVKADVLGRPVVAGRCEEPGVLGCAMMAYTALGRFSDLAAAQDALFVPAARCLPDPAAHDAHSHLHAVHVDAAASVAPLSRRLAALASPPLAEAMRSGEDPGPPHGSID